ncbi:MAG: glycosyltransferase [Candidatus Devosia phytovorans]|uniref:Glycosyltransferase n=1 Tax=Candidatus Devosia phytovorans TaxID=3121372 RepID=A0AAJ6B013_9HYPH|nr:glycosyltransferase family 2 protein [Devosia sp.]WEK03714.1 MAG: glycosyltransferase [Devosia sp.]
MSSDSVGVVVIGRNEGQRLVDCLASLGELSARTVYVDSGSSDGSQIKAEMAGVAVIDLDQALPFTAARARNAGYAALLKSHPDLHHVQFVDGDCTLDPRWIETASVFLDGRPEIALVCGRRRERHPEHSVYNAMCDAEWNGPKGDIVESGGDFLIRTECFSAVGGFRDSLIAGEEPELCLRLRERGWNIWRLDAEMTLHDANILQFRQWWRRALRAGHAFAEVAFLHRGSPKRIWQRNVIRALAWSAIAPIALLGTLITPWSLLLLLAYPANILRQAGRSGLSPSSWRAALYSTIGKFPEAQGVIKYHLTRLRQGRSTLIEYK